jgi:hypothetical protein
MSAVCGMDVAQQASTLGEQQSCPSCGMLCPRRVERLVQA